MPRASVLSTAAKPNKKSFTGVALAVANNDVGVSEVSKSNRLKALEEQYRKTNAELDVKTGALDGELVQLRASAERFEQPYEVSEAFRKYAPKKLNDAAVAAKKQRNSTITLDTGGGDATHATTTSVAHLTAVKVEKTKTSVSTSLLETFGVLKSDDEQSKDEVDLMFEYEDKLDQEHARKKQFTNTFATTKSVEKNAKPKRIMNLLKPSGTFSLETDEEGENKANRATEQQMHKNRKSPNDTQTLTKLSNAQLRKIINAKTAGEKSPMNKKLPKLSASPVILGRRRGKVGKNAAEIVDEKRNSDPLDIFDVDGDTPTADVRQQAMETKLHCLEEELKHEQKTLLHTEHELEQVQKRHENLHKQAQHFESLSKKLTEQLASYKTVADGYQASMQALEQRATQLHGDVEARERQMRMANTHTKESDGRINRLHEAHEKMSGELQQARAESDQLKQQLVRAGVGGGRSTLDVKANEHRLRMLGETLRKMARMNDTIVQQQQIIVEQQALAEVDSQFQELLGRMKSEAKS